MESKEVHLQKLVPFIPFLRLLGQHFLSIELAQQYVSTQILIAAILKKKIPISKIEETVLLVETLYEQEKWRFLESEEPQDYDEFGPIIDLVREEEEEIELFRGLEWYAINVQHQEQDQPPTREAAPAA